MIIVKINKWNDTTTSRQTSTIWELATDELFTNVIDKKEKTLDMYVYNIKSETGDTIKLDKGTRYYLRATRVFNNSEEHLVSDVYTIEPTAGSKDYEVSLIQAYDDVFVNEPTLSVDTSKLGENIYIVNTSEFKANRGTHVSTSWYVLDNSDDVVYAKMNDTTNLTSIELDTRKEWWNNNDTLRVYAIHTSSLRKSSKAGMLVIKPNEFINYSIELPNYLEFDTKYTIPVITKSNLYSNGIYKVKVYNEQVSYDIVGSDISSIVIPAWVVIGSNINILVHYTTINGQLYSRNYTIPIHSTGRHLQYNHDYLNQLDTSVTISGSNKATLNIDSNYQGEFLHNGYIPVVNNGSISMYTLIDNDLRYIGNDKILVDSNGNAITYTRITNIRRMSDTLLAVIGIKDNKGVISIYRYMSTSGKYELVKDYSVDKEVVDDYGKGNSITIMNNNEIWYKKNKSSNEVYRLKLITGEEDKVTTVSGLVSTGTFIDENKTEHNNVVISPSYIGSNNSLVAVGGHTTSTFRHDGAVEISSKPLYSPQFPHNQLGVSPLINGDSLVYKKTNYNIELTEATELIANNIPSVSFKTLEEEYSSYKELSDTITEKTILNVGMSSIDTTYEAEFDIPFTTNITDISNYYVKCDSNLFKIVKSVNGLKVRVEHYNSKYITTRYIKIVASRNQVFDQNTFNATKPFTATVVELEILIRIIPDTLTSNASSLSSSSGNGYMWFNGKNYNRHDEIELTTYLGNVSFPFKMYGLDANDFDVTVDSVTSVVNNFDLTRYSDKLLIVNFTGITYTGVYTFTISDVIGTFLKVRVTVLGERDQEAAPTIAIRDSLVNVQEPIGFIDKRLIPFTINEQDDVTIVNSSDDLISMYRDNPYLDTKTGDVLNNRYGMIVNTEGIGIFYVKNNKHPNYIYTSNYFIYCVIDGTIAIEPDYQIAGNTKIVTLSKDYYVIKSDITRYNNRSIFDIQSDGIVAIGNGKITITLPANDKSFIGTVTAKEKLFEDKLTDDYITTVVNIADSEDEYYAYFKNTDRLKYSGKSEDVFIPISVSEKWYELEVSDTNDVVEFGNGVTGVKQSDKTYKVKLNNPNKLSSFMSYIYINRNTDKEIIKTIKAVPVLFVINDGINGDVPIEQYPAIVSSLDNLEYDIKTISDSDSIYTTTIETTLLDDESKYRITSDYNENNFKFKIVPDVKHAKLIDKLELWLNYDYVLPDESYIKAELNAGTSQVMTIYLTEYPPVTFLKIDDLTSKSIAVGSSLTLGVKTNGTYKITSSDESIISVNGDTLNGLKEGYACITVIATKDGILSAKNELYIAVTSVNTSTSSRYAIVKHNINNFAMYTNTELPVTWSTDADSLIITSSNENIVKYDNIRGVFIAGNYVGSVTITVTTKSTLLLTTIETFNLTVMARGDTEPGILIYKADTSEFVNGPAYTSIIPKSSILTKQGYVILAGENGKIMLYK